MAYISIWAVRKGLSRKGCQREEESARKRKEVAKYDGTFFSVGIDTFKMSGIEKDKGPKEKKCQSEEESAKKKWVVWGRGDGCSVMRGCWRD